MREERWLAAGAALIAATLLAGRAPAGERQVPPSVEKAIRTWLGAVFVVRIECSAPLERQKAVWHVFTVEEVVKPYRSDDGTYFVPLMANEETKNGTSKLMAGRRYLIVTRLRLGARGSQLFIEDSLDLAPPGHDPLLEGIRATAAEQAVYGTSPFLRSILRWPLDVEGVRTRHANGLVDPEPFGFTEEGVRAAVGEGMRVLVVRPRPGDETRGDASAFDVLEDLGRPKAADRTLRACVPWKGEELEKRSTGLPAPYRLPELWPHRRYILLVEPRTGAAPLLKAYMPAIRDDDPAVRKVRGWLANAAGRASMDALSKELLDAWMGRQYDLTRAGAKEASCRIRAKFGEAPGRVAEGTGEYRWNGESGSLTWDHPQLGAALAREGLGARKIDMWFRAERRVDLDRARLTATRGADGGAVLRDGGFRPPEAGGEAIKEVRFGADGVLVSTLSAVRGEIGGVADATLTFRYERVDGLYAMSGWTMELEVGATPYSETTTVTHVRMGGFLVPKELASRSTAGLPPNRMELKKVLTFSDWRINGKALRDEEDR